MRSSALIGFAAALALPMVASAGDLVTAVPPAATTATPPPPPAPKTFVKKEWYGWQLLILHGVSDSLITLGFGVGQLDVVAGSVIGGLGLVGRVFCGMGLHINSDNPLIGGLSVVANAGFPLAGVFIPVAALKERSSAQAEIYTGLAIGMVAASAFDVSMAWSHLLGASDPSVHVGPTSLDLTIPF